MNRPKRRTYILTSIVVLIVLVLLTGLVLTLKRSLEPPAEAISMVGPPEYIDPNADPVEAQITVHVNSVGNLELATGIYFMDFYLIIECDRPCRPAPDILNAVSQPEIEQQNADTRGGTFYSYRVRANLLTGVRLDDFPFDEQVLTLAVGDKHATKSEMVLQYDPELTAWDYGGIHMLGWSIKGDVDQLVVEDAYPWNLSGLYQRYYFSLTVFRPWISSFINNLFPVIIIMLVGLLSFLMGPDTAGERLALTSSTLVALILFHINLNASLPPLSTLTYADKFMLVNYLTASVATAAAAVLLVLRDHDQQDAARWLNRWAGWAAALLWALLLLGITIWQFSRAEIAALLAG